MKRTVFIIIAVIVMLYFGCSSNPMTGRSTMALVSNQELLASSFQQYDTFLKENKVIEGTADARMVQRIGDKIKGSAEKWLKSEGNGDYLKDYRWEYHLVENKEVNAWCMPGGKIVVYTGILPVTKTEAALAAVMGHEVCHALLNHGQQRMSADVIQQLGASGVSILTGSRSPASQQLAMTAYGAGSQLFGILPFSRSHESEADHYGLILMAIAGYNPQEAVTFWERMASLSGGSTPELLSTHPSDSTRIRQIQNWIPEAKEKAASFGVSF
ncbi:MAG: M48 family metallopeptidase [Treponema sp.]|jgi:predicted Zn-dependent protease|nr:M48 family metallopeptidase [Treponema sp.]